MEGQDITGILQVLRTAVAPATRTVGEVLVLIEPATQLHTDPLGTVAEAMTLVGGVVLVLGDVAAVESQEAALHEGIVVGEAGQEISNGEAHDGLSFDWR